MSTASKGRRRRRKGGLYTIRITDLDVEKGPGGRPVTRVAFDVLETRFGKKIRRSALYRPGKPPAFAHKGSVGLVMLDEAHIHAAPEPVKPGARPSAQSLGVIIWLWTKIAEAPGLPPTEEPPAGEPPPSGGPAKDPKPPYLGGGGGGGVIIIGPGGGGGGAGVGPSDLHEIAESICEEAGEPGSEEFEECMVAFLTPDFEPSETEDDGRDTGGGGDTGDTGGGGEGFRGW